MKINQMLIRIQVLKIKTIQGHIKKERSFLSKIRQWELYFCFTETGLYSKNDTPNKCICRNKKELVNYNN